MYEPIPLRQKGIKSINNCYLCYFKKNGNGPQTLTPLPVTSYIHCIM